MRSAKRNGRLHHRFFITIPWMFLLAVVIAANANAQWTSHNGPEGGVVRVLHRSGGYLFAGTDGGGVFRSVNPDSGWTQCSNGLTNSSVKVLYRIPESNELLCGT